MKTLLKIPKKKNVALTSLVEFIIMDSYKINKINEIWYKYQTLVKTNKLRHKLFCNI